MAMTNDFELPPASEIVVPRELEVSSPALRAGAYHLAKYCEVQCQEFIQCRDEMKDPRKCLKEGADTTACGVNFFQKVKKYCRDEFNKYAHCIEHGHEYMHSHWCRKPQRIFDKCMFEKMKVDRPPLGYYSRPMIYDSPRPQPPPEPGRDYYAEAAKLMNELPDDYPIHKEYKRYFRGHIQPYMS